MFNYHRVWVNRFMARAAQVVLAFNDHGIMEKPILKVVGPGLCIGFIHGLTKRFGTWLLCE